MNEENLNENDFRETDAVYHNPPENLVKITEEEDANLPKEEPTAGTFPHRGSHSEETKAKMKATWAAKKQAKLEAEKETAPGVDLGEMTLVPVRGGEEFSDTPKARKEILSVSADLSLADMVDSYSSVNKAQPLKVRALDGKPTLIIQPHSRIIVPTGVTLDSGLPVIAASGLYVKGLTPISCVTIYGVLHIVVSNMSDVRVQLVDGEQLCEITTI